MAPALLLFFIPSVWVTLSSSPMIAVVAAAADRQGGERCPPVRCGNVTITSPFGVVPDEATETNCGGIGFQVHCSDNTPYLGYNQREHWLQILNIFYDNASLLVADIHKLQDLDGSVNGTCHIPTSNSSTKVASPFSISPLNLDLIFYNCIKAPAKLDKVLVETRCGGNTFVRAGAGGRYGVDANDSGSSRSNILEGCDATVVPVLAGSGTANASRYLQLISDGFLLTWQASKD